MKMLAALIFLLSVLSGVARAEMTAITVAASIQSFTEETVTIQVGEKRVRVPRGLIKESNLHIGDAILVTFQGKEIHYLFADGKPVSDSGRNPASEKKRHEHYY